MSALERRREDALASSEHVARIGAAVARFAASWPRVTLGPAAADALVTGLSDLPADEVEFAIEYARRTMTFPPAIAEIRQIIAEHRLLLPEPGEALELVQRYVAAESIEKPCPARCRDGLADEEGTVCPHCRGNGSVYERAVELPGAVQRALVAVGGKYGFQTAEHPGAIRRDFLKLYEEFRTAALREITAGPFAAS